MGSVGGSIRVMVVSVVDIVVGCWSCSRAMFALIPLRAQLIFID